MGGIAIESIAKHDPCLNSARAAAACRSVRDAVLQVSLRLQVRQERCRFQQNNVFNVPKSRESPLPSPGSDAAGWPTIITCSPNSN